MNLFSYKLDHDFGLAPNPFWGFLTLAVCKSQIRKNKNLKIGDWIVGTGGKEMRNTGKLIFAMKVEEILTFDEYWKDPRFECKKPVLSGSLVQMYGDNIYHTNPDTGMVIQEPCAHSHSIAETKEEHIKRDSSGLYVPISQYFFYFGDRSPVIPRELSGIINGGRDYHYKNISPELRDNFIVWLETNYSIGIYGDPTSWSKYNLPKLNIYEG